MSGPRVAALALAAALAAVGTLPKDKTPADSAALPDTGAAARARTAASAVSTEVKKGTTCGGCSEVAP